MNKKYLVKRISLALVSTALGAAVWTNNVYAEQHTQPVINEIINYTTDADGMIYGGASSKAAHGYTLYVKDSTFEKEISVYGAISNSLNFASEEEFYEYFINPTQDCSMNTANANKVILKNAILAEKIKLSITGGYSDKNIFVGGNADANNNIVFADVVNNADIVVGGQGKSASFNEVYYNAVGNGYARQIIGGSANSTQFFSTGDYLANSSAANGNNVVWVNGTAQQVAGGNSSVSANNNNVIVLAGKLKDASNYANTTGMIYSFVAGGVVNGDGTSGEAINNTVNLAGYLGEINVAYDGGENEKIYINSPVVNYSDEIPELKGVVYGGYCSSGGEIKADLKSGNTLNVFGTVNGIENIANFSNVNFYLPTTVEADTQMLELTGKVWDKVYSELKKNYNVQTVDTTTDLTDVVINTNTDDMPSLKLGESIGLISNPVGIITKNTTYKIDCKATDAEKNVVLAAVKEAGIELKTLGYEVDDTSISLKLKDEVLTGKYLENGETIEKELALSKAEAYGKVYGAYGVDEAVVNINESLNLPKTVLYGSNISANNTLNVNTLNNTLKNIANFNSLNFAIPVEAENGAKMLSLTDSNAVKLNSAKINAGVRVGSNLKNGDSIILLDTVGGIEGKNIVYGYLVEGMATEYSTEIINDGNKLVAKVGKKTLSKNAKSPAETVAANIALLNAGQDMAAGAGMANAQAAAGTGAMAPFAAVGGSSLKHKTGSHVDVKGWNMNIGVAKEIKNKQGKLLLAPMLEHGHGNYDSYLDTGLHGSGNSHFWGAGFMAKQTKNNGFYYEGSMRGGKLSSNYEMKNGPTKGARYDTSAAYAAAHVGVGKEIKLSQRNSLDYYGKYFFTHQKGDTVNIKTPFGEEKYHFESVNSQHTRLGTRFTHKLSEQSSLYAGLAWQYEFDGEARAITRAGSTPAPSLKGHSGIAELGVKLEPSKAKYTLDLGLTVSAGKQKGMGLNLQFNWKL